MKLTLAVDTIDSKHICCNHVVGIGQDRDHVDCNSIGSVIRPHDLYDGPALNNRRRLEGLSMAGGPTKLVVSNLDYGVLSSDIQ
ncbi:hypothetical protein J6590_103528, partial [Homalodisca vitripennis]